MARVAMLRAEHLLQRLRSNSLMARKGMNKIQKDIFSELFSNNRNIILDMSKNVLTLVAKFV